MHENELIYVVDDDKNIRRGLEVALSGRGYRVETFADPLKVIAELKEQTPDLMVFDICMGEISGLDLYERLLRERCQIPVIFMSGESSTKDAVRTVQMGAFDFLQKPFNSEKLLISIERCLELQKAKKELINLKEQTIDDGFLGKSKVFKSIRTDIMKVAPTISSVLISGESGTGKELIAMEVHKNSKYSNGPFIKVNCAAIPESLVESEFFGHVKGAFTGASSSKKGFFEQAHMGTLFLDEIGEMSLSAQSKVLRAIQSMEIQKVGSEKTFTVDTRIVSATNRNLEKDISSGNFREDLYYRINVFPISSAPLRERKEDIPLLVEHFLNEYVRVNNLSNKFVSQGAMDKLINYTWPGNIRELKNIVERMAILGGQTLDESHLFGFKPSKKLKNNNEGLSLKDYKATAEKNYIIDTLRKTDGNVSEAATYLDLERTYLHKKIQQLSIKKKDYFI